jgi:hypothetical protein
MGKAIGHRDKERLSILDLSLKICSFFNDKSKTLSLSLSRWRCKQDEKHEISG